jgi:ribosome-binding protein aMBF1 (putative translation factor)
MMVPTPQSAESPSSMSPDMRIMTDSAPTYHTRYARKIRNARVASGNSQGESAEKVTAMLLDNKRL